MKHTLFKILIFWLLFFFIIPCRAQAKTTLHGRESLTSGETVFYDHLIGQIRKVSALSDSDTRFLVLLDSYSKKEDFISFTADDLGVSALYTEENDAYTLTPEAESAIQERFQVMSSHVLNALIADCPIDLYWFDKNAGMIPSCELALSEDQSCVVIGDAGFSFSVFKDYQGNDAFTLDAGKAQKIDQFKSNLEEILYSSQHSQSSALKELEYFKEQILSFATYDDNTDAGWQTASDIVSLFDGDPDTATTCEGYAKAFQYLCNASGNTTENIDCITVYGKLRAAGQETEQSHAFNIVSIGGETYLVDLTNCDEGTIGDPDLLFLCGSMKGDPVNGYVITIEEDDEETELYYSFLPDQITMFGTDRLTLAKHHYGDVIFSWEDDYSACAAAVVCDGKIYEAADASVEENTQQPDACTTVTTFTASAYGEEDSVTLTDTKEHETETVRENDCPAGETSSAEYDTVIRCKNCDKVLSLSHSTILFSWYESGNTPACIATHLEDSKVVSASHASVTARTQAGEKSCQTKTIYTAEAYGEQAVRAVTVTEHTPSDAVKENYKAATVDAPASWNMVTYCSVCGEKLSSAAMKGNNCLKPTGTLTVRTLPMNVKQTVSLSPITGLAAGDYVMTWATSDKKAVTVTATKKNSCRLVSGSKKGSATITATLHSKKKLTFKVTVRKGLVRTTALKVTPASLTLKKGKTAKLAISRQPFSSQEKIRCSSSKKAVVSVSSAGLIKAKSRGTCVITVSSGRISKKIKVKVTG